MGTGRGDLVGNLVVGVIGAVLGGLVLGLLGFAAGGLAAKLITATGGAMLLIALLRAYHRRRVL